MDEIENYADIEVATDPSLIIVHNIETGDKNLTIENLAQIQLGYFWEDKSMPYFVCNF